MHNGLQIDSLIFKNFMSVGNVAQTVTFDNGNMRIITGEDLGSPTLKRSGIGKAQPLYSKVRVKNGWEKIGNIGIGDTVMTPKGTETIVTGVYPQGKKDVYTLTLDDGRKVKACKEHLWKVFTVNNDWHIVNTETLIEYLKHNVNVSLPLISDDCDEDAKLPLHPYFLSLCLVAGEISDSGFINLKVFDEEIEHTLQHVLTSPNITLVNNQHNTSQHSGIVVFDEDNQVGNTVEQFINQDNLMGFMVNDCSWIQRKEFLRAILDVYGYEDDNGDIGCIFTEEESKLRQLTQKLVWSLGGTAKSKKIIVSDEIFNIVSESHVTIKFNQANQFFSVLSKKVFPDYPSLMLDIKDIKLTGNEDCVCISVLSDEKLYVTDNYVITHNTTVPNALSYALYNKPVAKIKTALLPNTTNKKGMFVRVDFRKDGQKYYIERGIKPDIFKFVKIVDGEEKEQNDTQGTKADTQLEIERLVGMSHDLFTMIVTINTINDCFMKKPLSKQRDIIEEIFNISELTHKAKILSEYRIKETKLEIEKEKVRLETLSTMKIRAEQQLTQAKRQHEHWDSNHQRKLYELKTKLESFQKVDIDEEIEAHETNDLIREATRIRNEKQREIDSTQQLVNQGTKRLTEINRMLESFTTNTCPTCEQEITNNSHKEHERKLVTEAQEYFQLLDAGQKKVSQLNEELTPYTNLESIKKTVYSNINEAYNHQHTVNTIIENIESLEQEVNPHKETVDSAEKMLDDSEIDYSKLEHLEKQHKHQLFLQKMLTGRDSFIRKRIIDISLPVLNQNIERYLRSTNIRHEMKFQSDLTLEIFKAGNEYDFEQLSRGEQNWAIIALNMAMRDLYEDLSGTINLIFVDELIDFGVDLGQSIDAFNILKEMTRERDKSVALITHREELFEKADDILYTLMENDFTSYEVRTN